MKRPLFLLQASIQFFVALGALVSGTMLIIAPSGELVQASSELLVRSPFRDFLIPGIILVSVNGLGQLAAGILTLRRHPLSGLVGITFGLGLVIWIYVQVMMIGGGHTLQHIFFGIGVIQTALSFLVQNILRAYQGQRAYSET